MRHFLKRPWFPYVFPLAVFFLLSGLVQFFPDWSHLFYISKTIIVGVLLWSWRQKYTADISPKLSFSECLVAVFAGVLVLVIWIVPEGYLPQIGQDSSFDPYAFGWSQKATYCLIAVRMTGAALVVPVMEELFWRSFLLRYLIDADFRKVPLGAFSWYSFLCVALLFGLEHHRIIVGIIAGVIYNLLLIHQKKLRGCILAHGITNLGLGIYVLLTESWMFW
ncbi:MAG: CAAX prenyl protease-related protein [Thermodesulfobacteriota bacterium]|nr:CAAX prenyl protease-related protein [Thermodesulfobacteriota bacterium]